MCGQKEAPKCGAWKDQDQGCPLSNENTLLKKEPFILTLKAKSEKLSELKPFCERDYLEVCEKKGLEEW
jgi:hypothetical protein